MQKSKTRKKVKLLAVGLVFLMNYSIVVAQVEQSAWASDRVVEETYYSIGTQAYIYSVTPYMMYCALYQTEKVPYENYKEGVPFNAWIKVNNLANVKNSRTVMANVNTLYASTWLDLRKEPILLEVPEFGNRYYSLGLQDAYMNYFSIIGSRTIGGGGGRFIICGPEYHGVIPKGFTKVESPTPLVWMLMRIAPTYVNEEEVEFCRKLQAQVTITPLSQQNNPDYNAAVYNTKLDFGVPDIKSNPLKFFEIAQKYIQLNRPQKGEDALFDLFHQIGFGEDQEFQSSQLTEPQKKGLMRAMEAGKEMVNNYILNGDNIYNGWTIQSKEMGRYGYSYLTRAALTMQSIGGFPWEEAIYVVGYKDINGNELDGAKEKYVLHFEKNEIPKVNQFWSVTLYELPSVMLYDNSINRYQMGPQLKDMQFNKDGSLDIYIQHTTPSEKSKQKNWLPAPDGKFVLSLRMYNPKPEMFQLDAHKVPLPGVKPIK